MQRTHQQITVQKKSPKNYSDKGLYMTTSVI